MAATTVPANWTATWGELLDPAPDLKAFLLHQQHGGYDVDLVGDEASTEELLCDVCSKLLRDPRLTLCCGKHYCETCLDRWLEKQEFTNSCPQCRNKPFQHVLDKSMKRRVSAIQVHCIHKDAGCEWEGELGTIEAHLDSGSGCGYVPISCPNHCNAVLNRISIQIHLANECELRECTCEHCGFKTKHQKITEHYEKCAEYPLPCPKGCDEPVLRKHLAAHKHKCSMEEIECPFASVGCYASVKRRDYEDHLKQEAHTHTIYFIEPFQKLKASFNTLSTNVNELCAQQIEDRRKMEELQTRLAIIHAQLQVFKENQDFTWLVLKVGLALVAVLVLWLMVAGK